MIVITSQTKKLLLVAGVAAMLLTAYRFGAFETLHDPARFKETLLAWGSLGFLAYLLAYVLIHPFGVPGVVFIAAAGLVWPPPVAIALSLFGSTLASVTSFSFARYIARDWVEKKIPTRLRRYDERLRTNGFATVFVLRSVFWTNQALHALFGLSRVPFWTHLIASLLAYIVPAVAITLLGDALFDVIKHQPLERWAEAAAIVAVAVTVSWVVRRAVRRRSSIPTP